MNAIIRLCVRLFLASSLIWSQTLMAAKPNHVQPISQARNLIKSTGISSKPTLLRDVFEVTKDRLPMDFRYEVERFLEIYPNYKLPQGNVRTVKNGKHEDLQLTFVQGKESVSIVMSLRGDDVGSITFSNNGKDVNRKLTQGDLANPVEMVASVLGGDQMLTKQFAFTRVLFSSEIAALKPEQQKAYMKALQDTVAAMEKLQAARVAKKKTVHNPWLFGEVAHAATGTLDLKGKSCISGGGWVGKFTSSDGSQCQAPENAFRVKDPANPGQKVEFCNPAIYGGTYDFKYGYVDAGSGATGAARCRAQAEAMNFEPVFKWAEAAELDAEYKRVNDEVNRVSELCARDEAVKDKQKDQCDAFAGHAEKIRQANTAMMALRKGPSSGEVKSATPDITAREVKPPGARDDERAGPGTTVRAPPARVAATGVCQGLPETSEELRCGQGNSQSLTCDDGSTRYFCVCSAGSTNFRAAGGKVIRCGAGRVGSYDRDRIPQGREPVEGRWYDKPVGFLKNNWAPLLGLGVMIVGGMLLIKANESSSLESIDQYYRINQPTSPVFAPPPFTTLPITGTGTGSQFPSIPGRPAVPGGAVIPGSGYSFPQPYVPGAPTGGVLKRGIRNPTTK